MDKTDSDHESRNPRRWGTVAAIVLAIIGLVVLRQNFTGVAPPAGISENDFRRAEREFQRRFKRAPTQCEALMLMGNLAVSEHDDDTAIACYQKIPTEYPRLGIVARFQEAELLARAERAREAESSLDQFFSLAVGNGSVPPVSFLTASHLLSNLYTVELRYEDRQKWLAEVNKYRSVDVNDSKMYYFPQLLPWNLPSKRDQLRRFLQHDPGNHTLRTAQARYLTGEGRFDEARQLLRELQSERPQDLNVVAALLECCFARSDWTGFADVAQALPAYRDDEPWLLTQMRGEFAVHSGRWNDAVQHFTNVLRKDSTDPTSTMRLAEAFEKLGETQKHESALQRSRDLAEIQAELPKVTEADPAASRKLAGYCKRIGLNEAAHVFNWHADRIQIQQSAAKLLPAQADSDPDAQ